MIDGVPVLLAKPQTYINLSGESVCITFGRIFNFII
jgi:peptidyl-tRNA hydrolase